LGAVDPEDDPRRQGRRIAPRRLGGVVAGQGPRCRGGEGDHDGGAKGDEKGGTATSTEPGARLRQAGGAHTDGLPPRMGVVPERGIVETVGRTVKKTGRLSLLEGRYSGCG